MEENARQREARRRRATTGGFDMAADLEALPERSAQPPRWTTRAVQTLPTCSQTVIDHYLTSREFNGLAVGESTGLYVNAERLIHDGLIQLVTTTNYMNTHIRPWVNDDADRQASELAKVVAGELMGCVYPTPKAMKAYQPKLTHAEPYRNRMTLGHGTLELVYFDLAVVEGYVNDPGFTLTFGDDGFKFATAPDTNCTDADLYRLRPGTPTTTASTTEVTNRFTATGLPSSTISSGFRLDTRPGSPRSNARVPTCSHTQLGGTGRLAGDGRNHRSVHEDLIGVECHQRCLGHRIRHHFLCDR